MSWPRWRTCLPIVALLLVAGMGVHQLTALPPTLVEQAPQLDQGVPQRFGDWQMATNALSPVSAMTPGSKTLYSEQVVRTYENTQGQRVMLTLAYGESQTALSRIHDPQLCYAAAGFQILSLQPQRLQGLERASHQPLLSRRMLASRGPRLEAASYWIRVGDLYGAGDLHTRWYLTRLRLRGEIPDGILVRASMLIDRPDQALEAYPFLEKFLAELLAASPVEVRNALRS